MNLSKKQKRTLLRIIIATALLLLLGVLMLCHLLPE